jgi:hypothetical protein
VVVHLLVVAHLLVAVHLLAVVRPSVALVLPPFLKLKWRFLLSNQVGMENL